jgi:hypothetical protein
MPTLKKIFFLSVFIFFIALLFWGVYILSFKKDSANKADPLQNSSASDNQPTAETTENARISAVSEEPIISPVLTSGNAIRYFSKNSKQAFELDSIGKNSNNLTLKGIQNLADVFWSSDGSKAILKISTSPENFSYTLHDFKDNSEIPIKKNIDEVYWQENTNKIFYKYYDFKTKVRSLNISDPDGNNWKKLADVPYKKIAISQAPKSSLVSFWNTGDAFSETDFSTVPITGGDKKTIFKGKFGADYLWDKSGTNVLLSHTDEKGGRKMELAVINYSGENYRNLGIPTFISKCAWSKNGVTVYYALPGAIPENSILPDDYKTGKFRNADTFWKVDIQSGQKQRIADPKEISDKFDATQLFLNADESFLFFVNKIDGKLYKISL